MLRPLDALLDNVVIGRGPGQEAEDSGGRAAGGSDNCSGNTGESNITIIDRSKSSTRNGKSSDPAQQQHQEHH